jgi:hypothetical protein
MTECCANDAAIVRLGPAAGVPNSSAISGSSNVNLTSLPNATAIVEALDYTANCTLAVSWYYHPPPEGGPDAGFGNDSINAAFLRMALPSQYQNESDDEISSFYDDMSYGELSKLDWYDAGLADIGTACLAPQLEQQVTLADLNATQNCSVTAQYLSSLGWVTHPKTLTSVDVENNSNNALDFLFEALPVEVRNNITDSEFLPYSFNFWQTQSQNLTGIYHFLYAAYNSCRSDICKVQGYTGNPDIGGIGVSF